MRVVHAGRHQIVRGQQGGVITQRRPHIQRHGQQHQAQKDRAGFLCAAQPQPTQQCVGHKIPQPPRIEAAQSPQAEEPRHRHAQGTGQKGQDQKADRFGDGVGITALPCQILGKTVGNALHRAVLAVLFEGIPRRIVGLLFLGIGVDADARRGMGVDPGTGESLHQAGDILRVAAVGVKVEAAHGNGVGAQIMFTFIGSLQGRVGKGKQDAAKEDAHRSPGGKILDAAQCQGGSTGPNAQQHTEGRGPQRRDAPGVQPVKHPPVIAEHHAQQRTGNQHESPPHGFGPDGG